jgi:trehalose/maltose transport system substrate-binding protein
LCATSLRYEGQLTTPRDKLASGNDQLYEDEDIQAADAVCASPKSWPAPRPSSSTKANYNAASTLYFEAVHSVLTGDEDAAAAMELLELDLMDLLGG